MKASKNSKPTLNLEYLGKNIHISIENNYLNYTIPSDWLTSDIRTFKENYATELAKFKKDYKHLLDKAKQKEHFNSLLKVCKTPTLNPRVLSLPSGEIITYTPRPFR